MRKFLLAVAAVLALGGTAMADCRTTCNSQGQCETVCHSAGDIGGTQ
jgi:hypothetical protein